MCYSGSLTKDKWQVKKPNQIDIKYDLPEINSYYINAFTNADIAIIPQDNPDKAIKATWGLVPFWGKSDPQKFLSGKQYTNNARGEEMYEKKSYKGEVENHRCIILFDGFYEPHWYDSKQQQPYYCYVPKDNDYKEREILPIGGIYSKVDDQYYVSLVTTKANEFFTTVHNKKKRMPLVLDDNLVKEWIEPNQSKSVVDDLVHEGFTSKQFRAHPVGNIYSKSFNKKGIDIIEPVEPIQELLF